MCALAAHPNAQNEIGDDRKERGNHTHRSPSTRLAQGSSPACNMSLHRRRRREGTQRGRDTDTVTPRTYTEIVYEAQTQVPWESEEVHDPENIGWLSMRRIEDEKENAQCK